MAAQVPSPVKISRAAELLLWARMKQQRLQGLPPDLAPQGLGEAYEIQRAVAMLRAMPVAGFKIGLTNEEAQRAADTLAPIAGRLGAVDVRRSPVRIELPEQHLRVVEAEIVFEVGSDLPPARAPYTEAGVAASMSRAFAGIEICNTRFDESTESTLACLVADNSNADLIVVGDPLSEQDLQRLANLSVTLERRGKPLIQGSTGRVLGNPLRAVTWLVNWLASAGEGLKRGQLISSGSCTGMTEVAADDVVVATFGTGARVSVELVLDGAKIEVRK